MSKVPPACGGAGGVLSSFDCDYRLALCVPTKYVQSSCSLMESQEIHSPSSHTAYSPGKTGGLIVSISLGATVARE